MPGEIIAERLEAVPHRHDDPPYPTVSVQPWTPRWVPRRVIVDWRCDECGMVQRTVWDEIEASKPYWEAVRTIENVR